MSKNSISIATFRRRIRGYYIKHGRDLPWRRTKNPYHIVVSEIMLQQTQVSRVVGYYATFLQQFPTLRALAYAPRSDVLGAWQGLGYNRRALMLKMLAERVVAEYHGVIPRDPEALRGLPGIGMNTAGAIAAFAFCMPVVFIETNIRRVYIHFFFARKNLVHDRDIMPLIERTLDRKNPRLWYYALMDYGAMLGREKKENPNRRSRHYTRQSPFEGSRRQVRAALVRLFLKNKRMRVTDVVHEIGEDPERIKTILTALEKEGFITRESGDYFNIA